MKLTTRDGRRKIAWLLVFAVAILASYGYGEYRAERNTKATIAELERKLYVSENPEPGPVNGLAYFSGDVAGPSALAPPDPPQ